MDLFSSCDMLLKASQRYNGCLSPVHNTQRAYGGLGWATSVDTCFWLWWRRSQCKVDFLFCHKLLLSRAEHPVLHHCCWRPCSQCMYFPAHDNVAPDLLGCHEMGRAKPRFMLKDQRPHLDQYPAILTPITHPQHSTAKVCKGHRHAEI